MITKISLIALSLCGIPSVQAKTSLFHIPNNNPAIRICPARYEDTQRLTLLSKIMLGSRQNPFIKKCPNNEQTPCQKAYAQLANSVQTAITRAQKNLPKTEKIIGTSLFMVAGIAKVCLSNNPKYVCMGKGLESFCKNRAKTYLEK